MLLDSLENPFSDNEKAALLQMYQVYQVKIKNVGVGSTEH